MAAVEAPTGVLLGTFTPGSPEWEKARGGLCVTATEIAAVMGLSPWQSRFSLWHKKAGLPVPPFEVSPQIEWGNRLEPAVVGKYEDEHPDLILLSTGTWRHAERSWQRATPDRLIAVREDVDGRPVGIFEAKTSPYGDDWGRDGTDEVPVYYRCQVIWQQDTLGLHGRTPIGVLIGGCDYRELYVDYDEGDAKLMRDAAAEFLRTVEAGERPPIDGSDATYQTVRVQPDGLEDRDVEIPAEDAARYETAQRQMADAKSELTSAKATLLDHIGDGKRAVVGDRRIAYRTVRGGKTYSLNPYTSKDTAA
ncbi:YqaJ viral recombinase family protein [Streptomyces sp. NPDC056084]|uniref:YqaJ viral recombinase family nuclease n=1 Tax=unclassified Streptomyces TaxID=2593676 RepID=UPI0035D913AE